MLAQVEAKTFQQATSTLKSVLEKKQSLAILRTYLIEAVAGKLILKATNLNEFLTYTMPARVSRSGVVCVDGSKLNDIVKKLNGELILAKSNNGLDIIAGKTKFKLNGFDEGEFLEFPSVDGNGAFTLPSDVLSKAIDKVEHAIAKNDARIGLNSLYVHSVDGNVHFVASDGHRLAIYVYPNVEIGTGLLLSKGSLKALKTLLDDYEGEITITPSDQLVKFSTDSWELISRLSEGDYPDYKVVVDGVENNLRYTITLSKDSILQSLNKALAVGGSTKTIQVVFTFKKDQIDIKAQDVEFGEFQEEFTDVYDSSVDGEFIISFNARYLIEAIEGFDTDRITFGVVDDENPMIIYDEQGEYKALVMPMRI